MHNYFRFHCATVLKKKSFWIMSAISWIFPLCLFIIVPLTTKINTIFLFTKGQDAQTTILSVPLIITTAIFCGIIAVLVFKDSQENGTELIVASKPINRNKIIFAKYFVYIVCCCIYSFGIILCACPSFLYNLLHFKLITTSTTKDIFLCIADLVLGLLVTQAFFGSIAILVSAFRNKLTTILVPTIIVIVSYIVNVVLENAVPTSQSYLEDKYGNPPISGSYVAFDKNNNYKLDNSVWLTYNDESNDADKIINNAALNATDGNIFYFDIQQQLNLFFHIFNKEMTYDSRHSNYGSEQAYRYRLLNNQNNKRHDQKKIDFSDWEPPIFISNNIDYEDFPLTVDFSRKLDLDSFVSQTITDMPINAVYSINPLHPTYLSKMDQIRYISLEDVNKWASNENFQRYINYLIYGTSNDSNFQNQYWGTTDQQKQSFYLTDKQMDGYIKNQHHDGNEWDEGNWFYDGYGEQVGTTNETNSFGQLGWGGDFSNDATPANDPTLGKKINWQSCGHDYFYPTYRDWYEVNNGGSTIVYDPAKSLTEIEQHTFTYTFCKDLFENQGSFIYYQNPKSPFYQLAPTRDNESQLNTIYRAISMCIFQKHVQHFWKWYIWNWKQQNKPLANLPEWTWNNYIKTTETHNKDYPLTWPTEWNNQFMNNYLVPVANNKLSAQWTYNGGFPLNEKSHSASLQQYLSLLTLYSPYTTRAFFPYNFWSRATWADVYLSTDRNGSTFDPIINQSHYPPNGFTYPYYDNTRKVDSISTSGTGPINYRNLSQYTNSFNYESSIVISKTAFSIIYALFCVLLFSSQAIVFNKLDIK